MKSIKYLFLTASLIIFQTLLIASPISQKGDDLTHFPKGADPKEIGNRLVDHFVATPRMNAGKPITQNVIIYPEVCTWYGSLTFAKASGNKEMTTKLIQHFEPFFAKDSILIPRPVNVDFSVFGAVPLELFIQTNEEKYLTMGKKMADKQWLQPQGPYATKDAMKYFDMGYSWQTRLWVDDMFMITMLQTQAYRATKERTYLDRAAKEAVLYLDSLQQSNGLFFHAPDVPYFWGRGDGWFAVGMAELLHTLPKNHPDRPRIMKGYLTMMESLKKYQSENGMWHQLLDDPYSWAESSCTGMFTYAMITGVKEGWLNKKIFAPVARKGWLALVSYINEDGDVRDVCEGTNKLNNHQYYLDRKRNLGDLHGQAPVLWCATALLR